VTNDPKFVRHGLSEIKAAGHPGNPLDVVALVGACVLRPGETLMSPRVIDRIGPWAMLALHTIWSPEEIPVGPFAPPSLYDLAKRYRDECIMKMSTPMEKRFQEIHSGHLIFVKPQEKHFLSEELIKTTSYVASGAEINEKLKAMEEAGVKVIKINSQTEWAADPNLAIPIITAALAKNPGVKARLSGRAAARQRADLHAGGRQEARRDLQLWLRHEPADR